MQDLRLKRRFPIACPITLAWGTGRQRRKGFGRVLEIGSDAAVFYTFEYPPTLIPLTVSMGWPAPAESGRRLRLVIAGRLRKWSDHLYELRIERHEFRRCREHAGEPRAMARRVPASAAA